MSVTLTKEGLNIAGQTIPVYAGTVHYWRLERDRWPVILDQVKQLGFQMVETYIPWAIHETSPGHYDWGTEDDRKDVEAFINLCEERGLWLIVRPGPLINAELTDFGFPEWVLLDPAVQAHTAVGSIHYDAAWGLHPPHQFPVPSYASEAFYTYSAGWFDAICPIIARHLAPNGCIVAVQSDNETCYLFHDQTYATDYSPDSLKLYRLFLKERYHDTEKLNAVYQTTYADFTEIDGPRDCLVSTQKDLPWHLDWVAYKEYQIIWSVARFARMLRERGIVDVPIFHDVAFQQRTPLDVARMEAHHDIDWVGMNLYRNKEGYASAVRQTRFLVGSTKLPFVPEFGCGIWSHHPLTPRPEEQELITLGALMHGLKAFNLYMLVERDRWQGSAITRHGTLRPEYADFYQRLTHFLHHYQFWRFERDRQVLVLRNYDLGRYAAMTSTLNYAHADLYGLPSELFTTDVDLDLRWDAATEADEHRTDTWFGTLLNTLSNSAIDYDLADTHITSQQLAQYPLVFLQATDFMDINDQRHILAYIEAGGTVVVGPGLPYTDPTLTQTGIFQQFLASPGSAEIGKGRLIWTTTMELPELVNDLVSEPSFYTDDPAIDLAVLRNSEQTLLFAVNPTDNKLTTTLRFNGACTLQAAWQHTETLQGNGSISLTIAPYSVQIWEARYD
ncbi:MAG: beta-galactosidase [Chloroflexota bacterium]